jgi:uncharacterized membrane protein YccC
MPRFDTRSVLFSVNCLVAAVGALFIALAIGLPRPFWAMATVYIISQPMSGAVRSKAVYRLIGTLIGGVGAVVLVPNLVNSPPLLSLAIAAWVGMCLTVSLFDRSPRSYVMMLAGYTAAIIGFSSVGRPQAVFDVAVARVVEIGLGIICATLVHSFLFPQPVGAAVRARVLNWLADADHWLLDLAEGKPTERDRRHLAGAASDIRILTAHLPFDTSHLRDTSAAVQAIHDRMMLLIPLLSGAADRLGALGDKAPVTVREGLPKIGAWLRAGADWAAGRRLADDLRAAAKARSGSGWDDLLAESLLVRLSQAVDALAEAHAVTARLTDPYAPLPPVASDAVAAAVQRPLHGDVGMAFRSGVAVAIAILVACALWIGTGWPDGAAAAMIAAVYCAMFAALDDPAPAIASFGVYTLVGVIVAAPYVIAILPGISGFPLLAAALFPALFVIGVYMAHPRHALKAVAAAVAFNAGLALQDHFDPDFATFLNANLAQFVGIVIAVVVTRLMRSLSVEASVRRLLRRTHAAIGRLARAGAPEDEAGFAALLVDRIAQLAPKLSSRSEDRDALADGALRDLRVAMNLMTLQQVRPALGPADGDRVDRLSKGLAEHYGRRQGIHGPAAPESLLRGLDGAIGGLAGQRSDPDRRALLGLVGLRRNLFPAAPAFVEAAA